MEGVKGLKVFQLSYQQAMDIYNISRTFPKAEVYALTDQIRRSSRSVCANIAEGYRKRQYPKYFSNKMSDADAECCETMVWLDFARDCNYIDMQTYSSIYETYTKIGKMLGTMQLNPEKFLPKRVSISLKTKNQIL